MAFLIQCERENSLSCLLCGHDEWIARLVSILSSPVCSFLKVRRILQICHDWKHIVTQVDLSTNPTILIDFIRRW